MPQVRGVREWSVSAAKSKNRESGATEGDAGLTGKLRATGSPEPVKE
jgi:hypothetical protein